MAAGTPKEFLDTTTTTFSDDDITIAKLRNAYATQLLDLKNIFSDWSDADLLFALDEAGGAVDLAFYRISEGKVLRLLIVRCNTYYCPGHAERWEDARKKDKRDKKKGKQDIQGATASIDKPIKKQTKSNQKSAGVKNDDEMPDESTTSAKEGR